MFLTISSMWSLCKQLKPFAKSNLTKIWSSPMLSRKRRAACTAASQPPDTPTSTCTGLKNQQVWPKHRRKHIWQPVYVKLNPRQLAECLQIFRLMRSGGFQIWYFGMPDYVFSARECLWAVSAESRPGAASQDFTISTKYWGHKPSGPQMSLLETSGSLW